MSDNGPPTTIGQALYGPTGPASEPQGPTPGTITGGKAQAPAPDQWRGVPLDNLPVAAANPQPTPSSKAGPSVGQSLGESIRDPSPGSTAEAIDFTLPEGMEPHPELLGEFGTTARELKLDRAGADRLLALHAKAVEAATDHQAGEWRRQSEAAFSQEELADLRDQFNAAIGDDADAREFRQLLMRTGLGNNKSVIQVISRLLRR